MIPTVFIFESFFHRFIYSTVKSITILAVNDAYYTQGSIWVLIKQIGWEEFSLNGTILIYTYTKNFPNSVKKINNHKRWSISNDYVNKTQTIIHCMTLNTYLVIGNKRVQRENWLYNVNIHEGDVPIEMWTPYEVSKRYGTVANLKVDHCTAKFITIAIDFSWKLFICVKNVGQW